MAPDGKTPAYNAGDPDLIPGLGRSPGEGSGYSLRYSGLENSVDCRVHVVAKGQTGLSAFHFTVSAGSSAEHQPHSVPVSVPTTGRPQAAAK